MSPSRLCNAKLASLLRGALCVILSVVLVVGFIPTPALASTNAPASENGEAADFETLTEGLTEEQMESLGTALRELSTATLDSLHETLNGSAEDDATLLGASLTTTTAGERVSEIGTKTVTDYLTSSTFTSPILRGVFSYCGTSSNQDSDQTFYYSDSYFLTNPADYDTHLASMSFALALASGASNESNGYEKQYQNAYQLLGDTGYSAIHVTSTFKEEPGKETIAGIMGSKTVTAGDDAEYVIVPISVRGLGYLNEWYGNLTTGSSDEHANFAAAADYLKSELDTYLADQGLQDAVEAGQVKFWVTGYSRGGAVANLLAQRIVDSYQEYGCDVFGYTFATPKGALTNADPEPDSYTTIHNTLNTDDLVSIVAPATWKMTRYGVDTELDPDTLGTANIQSQLLAVDSSMTYNPDSFSLYKVNDISLSIISSILDDPDNILDAMVTSVSGNVEQSDFNQALVTRLVSWCRLSRSGYTSERTIGSTKYPALQTAIQDLFSLFTQFTDSDVADLKALLEDFDYTSQLSTIYTIYSVGILKYNKLPQTVWTKKYQKVDILDDIWGLLGSESTEGTIANALKAKVETYGMSWSSFKNDVYSVLDVLLLFTSNDSQTKASDISELGVSSSDTFVLTGTLVKMYSTLLQAHYPQIQLAMVRVADSFYGTTQPSEEGVTWTSWDSAWNTNPVAPYTSSELPKPAEAFITAGESTWQVSAGATANVEGAASLELRNQNPGNITTYTLTKQVAGTTTTIAENANYEQAISLDAACTDVTYTLTTQGWEYGRATSSATYTVTVAGQDHEWGEWVIDTRAGAGSAGSRHRSCAHCSETDVAVIPAYVAGDMNGSGTANVVDAQIVLDMANGLWTESSRFDLLVARLLNGWDSTTLATMADVNSDSVVNALDARAIQSRNLM